MTRATKSPMEVLPGIGPSMAGDLHDLGFAYPEDLRGQDPERMYEELCELRGVTLDRCVLYVFRCVVYVASNETTDPALRKWWNWKGRTLEKAVF